MDLYLDSLLCRQPQSLVLPVERQGREVRVAVYCLLGTDAALMECLQLRAPDRLAVPGLTAVTIQETGQGPGQWLPR